MTTCHIGSWACSQFSGSAVAQTLATVVPSASGWMGHSILTVAVIAAAIQLTGLFFAVDAVMHSRTPQGTIAWTVALAALPLVAIPFYLVFGARRFEGYVRRRRIGRAGVSHALDQLLRSLEPYRCELMEDSNQAGPLAKLVALPPTASNRITLLENGSTFFPALVRLCDEAKHSIVVQFYIFRGDSTGKLVADALIRARRRGVHVSLLYDTVGSAGLRRSAVWSELRAAGVQVAGFVTSKVLFKRLQINFRNHRKIVVADGARALVGGLNVGDEYQGLDRILRPWRDTATLVEGPAALQAQLAFAEDWYWVTGVLPQASWTPIPATSTDPSLQLGLDSLAQVETPTDLAFAPAVDATPPPSSSQNRVLIVPSGPADDLETWTLTVLHLINRAKSRLWIASPYFVPDEAILGSLQLAALRGVDVRVIIPKKRDQLAAHFAALSYLEDTIPFGIRIFQHLNGFMHQKVILSDEVCSIGTANLDNRSMRINFEVSVLCGDAPFADRVAAMLQRDIADSEELRRGYLRRRRWPVRFIARVARLLAPIL